MGIQNETDVLFPTFLISVQSAEHREVGLGVGIFLKIFLSEGSRGEVMSIGESYNSPPRVSSTYKRTIFEELEKIANNVDFRHPRFKDKYKRTRSVGSAQALIVEIALTDDKIATLLEQRLRPMMVEDGKHWIRSVYYMDKY